MRPPAWLLLPRRALISLQQWMASLCCSAPTLLSLQSRCCPAPQPQGLARASRGPIQQPAGAQLTCVSGIVDSRGV
jgi:hypothetical protein